MKNNSDLLDGDHKTRKSSVTRAGEGVEKLEPSEVAGKMEQLFWEAVWKLPPAHAPMLCRAPTRSYVLCSEMRIER